MRDTRQSATPLPVRRRSGLILAALAIMILALALTGYLSPSVAVRVTAWIIASVEALALAGCVFEAITETNDRRRYPPPGRLIDVGGHQLHLHGSGDGQPTVVLEAGGASWSFYWRLVQPEVARFARVCSYDRAGYGWSEPGPKPRAAHQIITELHALLANAGETGPFVLVGHSLGGVIVRQYARRYPQEVVGMVLVDSAHENQLERIPRARESIRGMFSLFPVLSFLARLGVVRLLGSLLLARFPSVRTPEDKAIFLALSAVPTYFGTSHAENLAFMSFFEAAGQEQPPTLPGDMPLIVIQADHPQTAPRGISQERWEAITEAWKGIQLDLVSLSSNGRLIVAEGSGHNIMAEQPDTVVKAIRQVVDAVRIENTRQTNNEQGGDD